MEDLHDTMKSENRLPTTPQHAGVVMNERSNHGFPYRRSRGKKGALTVLLLFCFLVWMSKDANDLVNNWIGSGSPELGGEGTEKMTFFDFNSIVPSEKLRWHPCFDGARCARLTVPMDYNRPLNASQDNPKVHIALSMIPGVGHAESGNYSASPLLVNPGGPGGAGAFFAIMAGYALQGAASSDATRDIVGFDPRGVGATTPSADCWSDASGGGEPTDEDRKTGAYNQLVWTLLGFEIPLVNTTAGALAQRDSHARAEAKLCKRADDRRGEDSILRHLSTPAVAHDMLSIIDAWDEWRVETGQIDNESEAPTRAHTATEENPYSLETKGKLVYWGFSYGTLLGATFAAMFPDRVGRVLLDGVVDADLYVAPMWEGSLQDTDKAADMFYHYCLEAGPSCAIYRAGDTEADIRARTQGVFQHLKEIPFSGVSLYDNFPVIISYSILKLINMLGLYSPITGFPMLAGMLNAFHEQDEEQILQSFPLSYPSYIPFCGPGNRYDFHGQNAQMAIMCTDKRYPLNESLPDLEKRFESLAEISRFADVWMGVMLGCEAFDITPTDPPMRWDDHPAHRQSPINTSFPLMFLSNSADPVTPLFAGVKMARKFVDAGLIEQKSEGHCSLAAASRCTLDAVRGYFEKGMVPKQPMWGPDGEEIEKGVWKRCEANEWPWRPFDRKLFMEEVEDRLQNLDTKEGMTDITTVMKEELDAATRMEDWALLQGIAWKFLRPRALTAGLRVEFG